MEAYELACVLLLKDGEPCWNCGGFLWLDSLTVPHATVWVTIGAKKAGEERKGTFKFDGLAWLRVTQPELHSYVRADRLTLTMASQRGGRQ